MAWSTGAPLLIQCYCLADQGTPSVTHYVVSDESRSLLLHSLRVNRDDSLAS